MSEVQRFWSHEASNIRCVREADFDELLQDLRATQEHEKSLIEDFCRVTAERDAALEREAALLEELATERTKFATSLERCRGYQDKQQHRLTAADERVDVLEGLLREVSVSVTGRNGTFARIPSDWFDKRDLAVLNPVEPSAPCSHKYHLGECTKCGAISPTE